MSFHSAAEPIRGNIAVGRLGGTLRLSRRGSAVTQAPRQRRVEPRERRLRGEPCLRFAQPGTDAFGRGPLELFQRGYRGCEVLVLERGLGGSERRLDARLL